MLGYCQLEPQEQTSVKFLSEYIISIDENAFENVVCEMAAILSRGRWVNPRSISVGHWWYALPPQAIMSVQMFRRRATRLWRILWCRMKHTIQNKYFDNKLTKLSLFTAMAKMNNKHAVLCFVVVIAHLAHTHRIFFIIPKLPYKILMVYCKTAVSSLLTHWSQCVLG